jgi:hypothetical protein
VQPWCNFFFVEVVFVPSRQNFTELTRSTHIITLKVPPPLPLHFRTVSNTPTIIVWNSKYKVILVPNITYSPETLRGNIYFESVQISYNTLLRNVSTFSLPSGSKYHWTWKCEVCYWEIPRTWTQNWSHKLISYKHGDGTKVCNYIHVLKFQINKLCSSKNYTYKFNNKCALLVEIKTINKMHGIYIIIPHWTFTRIYNPS